MFGAVLSGIAFCTLLAQKKVRQRIATTADDAYALIKEKISDLGSLTEEKYNDVIEMIGAEFSRSKKMAARAVQHLVKRLKHQWFAFQVYYLLTEIKAQIGARRYTKADFYDAVDSIVDTYTEGRVLADVLKKKLVAALRDTWSDFKGGMEVALE